MRGENAIAHAIDLSRTPTLSSHLRRRPLPPNVIQVIRVASGCPETTAAVAASTGHSASFLKEATAFYVKQILCFPGADRYRTLGLDGAATLEEMRLHMCHLLLGLHPDRSSGSDAAAARVIAAWRQLSRQPAAGFTRPQGRPKRRGRGRANRGYKPSWVAQPLAKPSLSDARRTLIRLSLGFVVFACGLVAPDLDLLNGRAPTGTATPPQRANGSSVVPLVDIRKVETPSP